MPLPDSHCPTNTILIIGASRGLGLAMAAEFHEQGWNVVGTVKNSAKTELQDLADEHPDRGEVEFLNITEPDQLTLTGYRVLRRSGTVRS